MDQRRSHRFSQHPNVEDRVLKATRRYTWFGIPEPAVLIALRAGFDLE